MANVHYDMMNQALARRETEAALELMLAAWEEGTECGIASELIAYAALYTALSDLVATYGEGPIAALSEMLGERIRSGEFTIYHTKQ
jgi:hypothetical protein